LCCKEGGQVRGRGIMIGRDGKEMWERGGKVKIA
jgi:hypothetical protein